MRNFPLSLLSFFSVLLCCSCNKAKEHIAPAVEDADSVAMMCSYGINMLVSDSGVIKYRLVTERCLTNENVNPKRNIFDKGAFLTEYDENFHPQAYVQADTAYQYTELKLIELRGRVRVINKNGLIYRGEQLFWDQQKRELYSHTHSYLKTPERTIEGRYFRSNEDMTKYYVSDSKGIFNQEDMGGSSSEKSSSSGSGASSASSGSSVAPTAPAVRPPMTPFKKR